MRSRNRQAAPLTIGSMSLLLAGRAVVRKWQEYSLRDRVVLIAGGSRGLGLVIARQMLRQGAKVAICARDGVELKRASNDLGRDHGHVLSVPCEVTDREQVHAMVGIVQRHFGAIDVLINNAGIIQVGPVELMTRDDYEKAMNVHF
jgi:NAD(P)-dependent dehydrogenase (short-subunit alcohol dehydrogenase family)